MQISLKTRDFRLVTVLFWMWDLDWIHDLTEETNVYKKMYVIWTHNNNSSYA